MNVIVNIEKMRWEIIIWELGEEKKGKKIIINGQRDEKENEELSPRLHVGPM